MATLTVPPGSVPYREPMQAIPSQIWRPDDLWRDTKGQIEQPLFVPLMLSWGNGASLDGGPANTIDVDLQHGGNSTANFKRIRSLYVNNEQCGVDVLLIAPDSGFPVSIPAYGSGYIPFATNSVRFTVVGTGAVAGDKTYIGAFNHMVEPVSYPKTEFNNVIVSGAIPLGAGSVPFSVGTAGTISQISMQLTGAVASNNAAAVPNGDLLQLVDGTPIVLAQAAVQSWTNNQIIGPQLLLSLDCEVRFSGGLALASTLPTGSTQHFPTGGALVNVVYRAAGT